MESDNKMPEQHLGAHIGGSVPTSQELGITSALTSGLKRYIVFAGSAFYPLGGWEDFLGSYDSVQEAVSAAKVKIYGESPDWCHVVDSLTGARVE